MVCTSPASGQALLALAKGAATMLYRCILKHTFALRYPGIVDRELAIKSVHLAASSSDHLLCFGPRLSYVLAASFSRLGCAASISLLLIINNELRSRSEKQLTMAQQLRTAVSYVIG